MVDNSDKCYTAEQVRGIDHVAIHGIGIAGYELMCRAGRSVFELSRSYYPSAHNWLVLCGPGNNGGDGYVVARLAIEAGIGVTVCSMTDPDQLKGDAKKAHTDWQTAGGDTLEWPLIDDLSYDLALDSLLGTGIDREVGGIYRQAIVYLNRLACPRLAIDIPSGLNADTGRVMGCAVRAQNTVTFVGRKRGMYTADGPDYCGHIDFDDLAIPVTAADEYADQAGSLLSAEFLASRLTPRLHNSHKGSFGHVLAVGGIAGMGGAIRLCGEAALRSGAGKVTLATDPAHADLINLVRPELMVKAITGGQELSGLLGNDHVLAVGPGLGRSKWSASLLSTCLGTKNKLLVDADGLNLLAERSRNIPFKRENWILTPHPAEAARLLGCKVSDIQLDRVSSALAIAQRHKACVVLKGCGTIVADSSGDYSICPHGNPGMATAGSGDVLTGVIAALLGQGLSCFDAARAGVLAHAMAGDFAETKFGQMAMMAGDITDCLPAVWRFS